MWKNRKYIMVLLSIVVLSFMVSCANSPGGSSISNDNQTTSGETFQVKCYEYSGRDEQGYTYTEETISQENMSEDSIKLVMDKYDIMLNRVWYEGERICIDISHTTTPIYSFDADSLAAVTLTHSVVQTFLSYPNVKEVELLLNGIKNVCGRHFAFGVFGSSGELAEPSYDNKVSSGETLQVKYYTYYNYGEQAYTYTHETISKENVSEDSVKLLKDRYDITINRVWYEGNRICVDISKTSPFPFDSGSSKGITLTCSLLDTFLSYPDVIEVELLVNGTKNVWGNHFSFGVFNSSGALTSSSEYNDNNFINSI
ncbi:MAG: hypothetical protein FWG14_06200 [Peptococcaceae bacterium]|nr:hypothetical protein [Peptococcaceae bacterium]